MKKTLIASVQGTCYTIIIRRRLLLLLTTAVKTAKKVALFVFLTALVGRTGSAEGGRQVRC